MTTTRNTRRRLFAVLMTLIMALSFAVPVFAAEGTAGDNQAPYQVTIVPNAYTTTGTEVSERYWAYQIFAGNPDAEYDGEVDADVTDPNTGYVNPNPNALGSITWGSGIKAGQIEALLGALMRSAVKLEDLGIDPEDLGEVYTGVSTLGDAFKAQLKDSTYWNSDALRTDLDETEKAQTAALIAKTLEDLTGGKDNNHAALAEAFAKIVAAKGTDGYTYLNAPEAKSAWDEEKGNWTIGSKTYDGDTYADGAGAPLVGGYYLIVDTHKETGEKVSSDHLVGVFGDTTIYVKSDGIDLDKYILGSDGELTNGSAFDIGDLITFRLKGTLPENYGNYDTYFYAFRDTMSEGLTFQAISRVYVKVGNDIYAIALDEAADDYAGAGYRMTQSGQNLTVTIPDLKALKGQKVTVGPDGSWTLSGETVSVPVTSTSELYVEYTAYLNENARIDSGNPNEFKIEFSNNPNSNDHGTTHTEYVYVYTFGLDIFKYDGSTENTRLPGAGFALTKTVEEETYYAIFAKKADEYVLAGWIDETALNDLTDGEWTGDSIAISGEDLEAFLGEGFGTGSSDTYYVAIVTNDTNDLIVKGLAEGAYILKEVIVPAGYDKLADIPVTFEATYFEEGDLADAGTDYPANIDVGMLKSLTAKYTINGQAITENIVIDGYWAVNNEKGEVPVPADHAETENTFGLSAHLNVPNFPEGWLPGTGGIGVTLFYVTGGLLLASAALYLIFSVVKKKKTQEQ